MTHQSQTTFSSRTARRGPAPASAPSISELRQLADRIESHGLALRSWASILNARIHDKKPLNNGAVTVINDGCHVAELEAKAFIVAVRALRGLLP